MYICSHFAQLHAKRQALGYLKPFSSTNTSCHAQKLEKLEAHEPLNVDDEIEGGALSLIFGLGKEVDPLPLVFDSMCRSKAAVFILDNSP